MQIILFNYFIITSTITNLSTTFDIDQAFYNAEIALDNLDAENIHLYRVKRGGRKHDIIVQGLVFQTKDEIKKFLSVVKRNCNVNGCHKMMETYDTVNGVFVFTGDERDKITDILVNVYNKKRDFITHHG